jgi:hypothetical protein
MVFFSDPGVTLIKMKLMAFSEGLYEGGGATILGRKLPEKSSGDMYRLSMSYFKISPQKYYYQENIKPF